MSWRFGPVGPRGLTVLAVTALVGALLAYHGWASYHGAAAPGSLGRGVAAAAPARTGTAPPSKAPARPKRSATAGPAATPSSAGGSPGPLLTAQSYAPYSFQVWPGPVSAAAKAALTGLSVTVHPQDGGLSVTAGVNGQPAGPPRVYRSELKVR